MNQVWVVAGLSEEEKLLQSGAEVVDQIPTRQEEVGDPGEQDSRTAAVTAWKTLKTSAQLN